MKFIGKAANQIPDKIQTIARIIFIQDGMNLKRLTTKVKGPINTINRIITDTTNAKLAICLLINFA